MTTCTTTHDTAVTNGNAIMAVPAKLTSSKIPAGTRFGRLTVLSGPRREFAPTTRRYYYTCQCDCGTIKEIRGDHLLHATQQSCGCLRAEVSAACASARHAATRAAHPHRGRLRQIWGGMRQRCYRPAAVNAPHYHDLGITICEEWLTSFDSFYSWALANGYQEGLSIDRIDSDGDYEPGNCRWVTKAAQQQNRRDSVRVTAWGETKTLPAWSHDPRCMVSVARLRDRYAKGMYRGDPEGMISDPPRTLQRTRRRLPNEMAPPPTAHGPWQDHRHPAQAAKAKDVLAWLLGQAAAGKSDAEISEGLLLRIAIGQWPGKLASRTYEAARHLLPSRAPRRTEEAARA